MAILLVTLYPLISLVQTEKALKKNLVDNFVSSYLIKVKLSRYLYKNCSMYQYTSKQELPTTMEKAWGFLSNPKNLKRITPRYMGFDIISGANRSMFPGQVIQYRLTPILGIPFRWVTEITHVDEGAYFVDEQRFGPYTFWHHKHFIYKTDSGVMMEDIVDYKLPLGPLGWFAHMLFVRSKVKQIFEYREKALNEIFNKKS